MLWLCGVCPRNAKMVYHAEINVINYVKRFRKETHMIISTDDKIQHPFLLEALSKVEIEGNFLYLIKDIYEKLTPNIILNGERLSAFLLRLGPGRGICL